MLSFVFFFSFLLKTFSTIINRNNTNVGESLFSVANDSREDEHFFFLLVFIFVVVEFETD